MVLEGSRVQRDFIYFFSFDTEVEKEYIHSSDEDKKRRKAGFDRRGQSQEDEGMKEF